MTQITAAAVKTLREQTGLGMMECKKALVAAEGDLDAARETLRVKSGARADAIAGRAAAEGAVAVCAGEARAALVEISSETDFVAREPAFIEFAHQTALVAAAQAPKDLAELTACEIENGQTIEDARRALVAQIRENIFPRRFALVEKGAGALFHYIHPGAKIGVALALIGGDEALGRDICLQIAAMRPLAATAAALSPDFVAAERRVFAAQAQESGKPPAIAERIAEGKLKKRLAEVVLTEQPFVKDSDLTIGELLAQKNASIVDFALFVVGEGAEKREDDFAAEVAKIAGGER